MIGEAVMADVPLLVSHIAGNVGLLGADYPGYFATGNTRELAELMFRAESDPAFLNQLRAACRKRKVLFTPQRETQAWVNLLAETETIS